MRVTRPWALWLHGLLLLGFAAVMVLVWLAPVLLAGVPTDIPSILSIRNYAATGMFSMTDAIGRFLATTVIPTQGIPSASDTRLSTMLFSFFVPSVPLTNLLGWSVLTALIFSGALVALWFAVVPFFGKRVAWIAIVLFALMPIEWREAVWLNHYQFAFLFLFLSFAAFGWLHRIQPVVAYLLSGALFGAAVASKDAIMIFLPWILGCGIFLSRSEWKKGVLHAVFFLAAAGLVYMLPYTGDIARFGYPVNQNLARIWPGAKRIQEEFYLHLYPDPYTYFFDRARFDAALLARIPTLSLIEQLQYQKILLNFDIGSPGFLLLLFNGIWLFLGSISSYFLLDTIGGMALWLFIFPGIVLLWRKDRQWVTLLLGLVVASEAIVRLILHYAREHLMDVGWVFALLAALGLVGVADAIAAQKKRFSGAAVAAALTLLLSMHLLQANRVRFANAYEKNRVPDTVAMAEAVRGTPEGSVFALPLGPNLLEQVAVLADRTLVLFAPETIDRLLAERKLPDAFGTYGITHIMRYDPERTRQITRSVRGIRVIESEEIPPGPPPVSTVMRFLLHHIR